MQDEWCINAVRPSCASICIRIPCIITHGAVSQPNPCGGFSHSRNKLQPLTVKRPVFMSWNTRLYMWRWIKMSCCFCSPIKFTSWDHFSFDQQNFPSCGGKRLWEWGHQRHTTLPDLHWSLGQVDFFPFKFIVLGKNQKKLNREYAPQPWSWRLTCFLSPAVGSLRDRQRDRLFHGRGWRCWYSICGPQRARSSSSSWEKQMLCSTARLSRHRHRRRCDGSFKRPRDGRTDYQEIR